MQVTDRIDQVAALLAGSGSDDAPDGGLVGAVLDAAAATVGARRISSARHRLHHRSGRSVTRVDRATIRRAGQDEDTLLVAHAHHLGEPDTATTVEVGGVDIAVWEWSADPYLPGLPRATNIPWVTEVLRRTGRATLGLSLRRRAYRPTRGAVIEARTEGARGPSTVFLKLLRPERLPRLARVHETLCPALPVPPVVSLTEGALLIDAIPGIPLRRVLREGGPLPPPDELVDISVRLAASGVDTGQDPVRRADPSLPANRLRPRLPDLRDQIGRIVEAATRLEGGLVSVHGDLHGGQLLTTDGAVTGLLDLDGVGRGHIVHDAANLIAYLEAQGDHRREAADRSIRYGAEVAAAYRTVVDPASLARATAGSWLALATVALRADDEPLMRRRVQRAIELIEHGG